MGETDINKLVKHIRPKIKQNKQFNKQYLFNKQAMFNKLACLINLLSFKRYKDNTEHN